MIKEIPGTEVVTLTTNGLLLGEQLESLMQAGLDAVNISLDTLDKEKYKQVTGFDKLSVVLASITKAVESGIDVYKRQIVANRFAVNMGINPEAFMIHGIPELTFLNSAKIVLLGIFCAGLSVVFCLFLKRCV